MECVIGIVSSGCNSSPLSLYSLPNSFARFESARFDDPRNRDALGEAALEVPSFSLVVSGDSPLVDGMC